MRRWLPSPTLLVGLAAAFPSTANADSRASFEIGGVVSSSPLDTQAGAPPPMTTTRQINSTAVVTPAPARAPSEPLVAVEVRPTLALDGGLRLSMGFRAGFSGAVSDGSSTTTGSVSLTGADLSIGYQLPVGLVRPFAEVRMGFNGYSFILDGVPHDFTQFRIDAVLGVRLYVGENVYLSGAAFAGWGDSYGGVIAVGLDVLRNRGWVPRR
jgi:hypothetical protein